MKHFLTLLLLACFSICIYAQSPYIEYRKVLDNGDNISIKTNAVSIKEKGQQDLGFSLMYETSMKENPEMSGYSLFVTFLSYREDWIIPLDGKLLIRTSSGKVISLHQSVSNDITLYDPETGYENNTYLRSAYDHYDDYRSSNVYRKFGKYPINEDDLKCIIEEGIIKVRIETTGSSLECEYPAEEEVRVNRRRESQNIVRFTLLPYYNALIENIDSYTTF